MTHDRCSELLRDYVGGELERAVAVEVEAHLAQCGDCRAEERAVAALATPATTLDDFERARLHRALSQELFTTAANADVTGTGAAAPGWRRWVGPAFAAAVVAIGVGFVGLTGAGSGDDSAAEGGAQVEIGAPAPERERDGLGDVGGGGGGDGTTSNDYDEYRADKSGPPGVQANGGESVTALSAASPQPEFDRDAGTLTAGRLSDIGRSGGVFTSFASSYAVGDARELSIGFLDRLADAAGASGGDVTECGQALLEEGTVLPAYGAAGRYDGRDVLVLGFVTTDSGDALDRYLMWVWPAGSCDEPVDTLIGNVDR